MKRILILLLPLLLLACAEVDKNKKNKDNPPGNPNTKACIPAGSTNENAQAIGNLSCQMVFSLASNACASMEWLIGPNTDVENSFAIRFTIDTIPYNPTLRVGAVAVLLEDENGVQNKRFDLDVTPNPNKVGEFFARDVHFKKGTWQIRVQLFDQYSLVEEHDGPFGLLYFN